MIWLLGIYSFITTVIIVIVAVFVISKGCNYAGRFKRNLKYADTVLTGHLDNLIKAASMSGVDTIYINKIDVLRELNAWNFIWRNTIHSLDSEKDFRNYISLALREQKIKFSDNPNDLGDSFTCK